MLIHFYGVRKYNHYTGGVLLDINLYDKRKELMKEILKHTMSK
jgi:hypothetical protein